MGRTGCGSARGRRRPPAAAPGRGRARVALPVPGRRVPARAEGGRGRSWRSGSRPPGHSRLRDREGREVGGPVAARGWPAPNSASRCGTTVSGSGRSEMSSPGNQSWCIWVRMSPGSTAYAVISGFSAANVSVMWSRPGLRRAVEAPAGVVLDGGVRGDRHQDAAGGDQRGEQQRRQHERGADVWRQYVLEVVGRGVGQQPVSGLAADRAERARVVDEQVGAAVDRSTQ